MVSSAALADAPKPTPPPILCAPAKELTAALIQHNYLAVAEMEVAHAPAIIFVSLDTGEYIVLMLHENMLCQIGEGKAFRLYRMRGA